MEILTTYNDDTLQLISDGESYSLSGFDSSVNKIKLSVFSDGGGFLENDDLTQDLDFYISNNQLFLKPNEFLDNEGFSEGNYNLQFDFITRYPEEDLFYISEISPSRKEIRLSLNPPGSSEGISESIITTIISFLNENQDDYNFNSFLELSQGRLIPINSYAVDTVSQDKRTLILKLNQTLPGDVQILNKDFKIANKFLSSQTETIFFIDRERLAISGLGLDIDEGYSTEDTTIIDSYSNYNDLTGSFGNDPFDELNRQRKDINLNIDYSKLSNHVFFGSAESKLKNFKDKAVKLEGLYGQINSLLAFSSSKNIIDKRKDLFKQANGIQDNFTRYEYFLYNDGQNYSTASAPGIGSNLAGTDFSNRFTYANPLTKTIDSEGFDTVYKKTTDSNFLHLFTDVYNAENPPFYNTNKAVYLSFIMRAHTGSIASPGSNFNLTLDGGNANINYDSDISTGLYPYNNFGRQLPFDAFSGSAILNPTSTGSNYQRYIFKGEQLYWRPDDSASLWYLDEGYDVENIFDWTTSSTEYEILSGSNVISASTSGSFGDGYAYGIIDGCGLHRPYFFPNTILDDGSNISGPVTASIMPQGDLFPVFMNSPSSSNAYFTDVKVSYNNPTDIHPFSNIYRPPSGSYDGSTTWNTWYDALLTTAQNYDNDNIHSLVNNLPVSLRIDDQHQTLRGFVNMLGEQFDLLRNYIDNYQNFYKMGYKNPSSIPDNLLPIIGDSIGFDLMNPYSGSITNYLDSNEGDSIDGVGIKGVINSLWKKILNNVLYVYKTKGTMASLEALMNLYGFDADSFKLREYGGSTEEHNPTVVDNTSADLLNGLKTTAGNIGFISETVPFPMLNLTSGSDYLALDWWTNNANPNGIEFVFHAGKSTNTQTILRSSGSNDYWDLRVVPSGSSNTKGKLEFRLNYKENVSSAIGTNHISMSTDYINNIMSNNIFNVMLQRNAVTASNALVDCNFSQSYHMFVARKDDDQIRNVQFISMSSHDVVSLSGSNINQNFITSSALTSQNLFMGETLSGSVAEIRTWNSYVSMSKFKQHVLNYHSLVGGTATSGIDCFYRFRLNENIPNWNRHPDKANLKIYDSNPQNTQDYSHLISTQPSLNYRTFMTEQTFYKFNVRGTHNFQNDNQTNLGPKLKIVGTLNPDTPTVTEPYNETTKKQTSYEIGRSVSYVQAVDSLIINLMSDFNLADYLEDGTMDGIYSDLIDLRKQLISDNVIQIDVVKNLKAAESILNNSVIKNLRTLLPAKSTLRFSYDVQNDMLYRSKIKNAILQTQLNPNLVVGDIGSATFEPDVSSNANQNYKTATLDMSDDELTTNAFANQNVKNTTIDILNDEVSLTSILNENVKTNHSSPLDIVDLSNSKTESIYMAEPDFTSILFGSKNEFYKNWGTSEDNTFYFHRNNQGTDGNYNTYKYETRFTFPTIGDTEEFHPVSGTYEDRTGTNAKQPYNHHDNFRHFFNRQFIDSGGGYTYASYFGVGAGTIGNAPKDGRMVGRTRFFSSSNGEIFYPSNHYIYARTSKDVLDNLIYKGTQNDGSSPTTDPMNLDPQRTVPAYTIDVGGSSTKTRLVVKRQ